MAVIKYSAVGTVSGLGTQTLSVDVSSLNGEDFTNAASAMWVEALVMNHIGNSSYDGPVFGKAAFNHDGSTGLTKVVEEAQEGLSSSELSVSFSESGDNIEINCDCEGGARSIDADVFINIYATK